MRKYLELSLILMAGLLAAEFDRRRKVGENIARLTLMLASNGYNINN